MPEDEFRTDLRWPTDPLHERPSASAGEGSASPAVPAIEVLAREELEELVDAVLARLDAVQREVHSDVTDLQAEITALRQSVDELASTANAASPTDRAAPTSLGPLLEELAKVRDELTSLRRRITLRVGAQSDEAVLSDEQIDRIAHTVADLLSRGTDRAPR